MLKVFIIIKVHFIKYANYIIKVYKTTIKKNLQSIILVYITNILII